MTKAGNLSKKIYLTYAVFTLIYLGFTLFNPISSATAAQYNMEPVQLIFVRLALAIPILAIWFVAFYAFANLREYAATIASHKEGKALYKVSQGIGVLAFSLPITAISSNILRLASQRWPDSAAAGFMIKHYIGILFILTAFVFILKGAAHLQKVKDKLHLRLKEWLMLVLLITSAVLFIYLSLTNTTYQFLGEAGEVNGKINTFYIPGWLLLITVIIPYIITWFIGLWGAYLLNVHKSRVKGRVYRHFLGNMSAGLTVVIVSSIMIQYINMTASTVKALPLAAFMAIMFSFLAVMAVGYILISRGSIQLKRIEEV